jgi:hypothetical protein
MNLKTSVLPPIGQATSGIISKYHHQTKSVQHPRGAAATSAVTPSTALATPVSSLFAKGFFMANLIEPISGKWKHRDR